MIETTAVEAFLSGHRFAVVGASDDPKNFGGTVLRALRDHGYEVVAVNPAHDTVAGTPCHPRLADVPGELDGVVVMVGAEAAVAVVADAIERGVPKVWLFKGFGPGAVSGPAVRLCEQHDVDVIAGACPLMFLEPVRFPHRVHRRLRRWNRSLVAAPAR